MYKGRHFGRGKVKKEGFSLIVLCITIVFIINITTSYEIPTLEPLRYVAYFFMLAMTISCVLITLSAKRMDRLLWYSILFSLWACFSELLNSDHSSVQSIIISLITLAWWSSVLILTNAASRKKEMRFQTETVLSTFYLVLTVYVSLRMIYRTETGVSVNTVYYLVLFTPFLLAEKMGKKSFVKLILIGLFVIASAKRTPVLALGIALFVYWVVNHLMQSKKVGRKFIFTCLSAVFVIIALFNYDIIIRRLALIFPIPLFERFANMVETGGSGRVGIYSAVWNAQRSSNVGKQWLGHGYRAVAEGNLWYAKSAHNDFLEILYDFGIVGLILYGFFILSLLRVNIKAYKYKLPWAPAFSASLALFFTISILSMLLIYPRYFIYFVLFWGCAYSDLRKCERRKNEIHIS